MFRYFGNGKRNQPVKVSPVNPEHYERHAAPSDRGNYLSDGFERLSQADPRSGARTPIGGTPVYPPYHEDL
jgi:hypothetical protein